ncbi:MAG: MASE1 domain-containing protein, partial [Acidobacteriaceae bacterium]|nr:MASE1 domain-containing protein [Acidobacteriaceae bacterium]
MIKLFDEPVDEPLQETIEACREEFEQQEKPTPVRHELWLLLSLFFIAFVLNSLVASHQMVLGFYTLPTLFSAYKYGRRHAVLTAFASVFMVVLVTHFNPTLFAHKMLPAAGEKWFELTVWGGILVITAYFMGTLCDRKELHMHELRESYHGILMILQHIATNDKYSQN